jgi:hypothetical protein
MDLPTVQGVQKRKGEEVHMGISLLYLVQFEYP